MAVIAKMGKTTPGIDGWQVHELNMLGREAWDLRAKIIQKETEVGRVPSSFTHAGTPMLPKMKATEKPLEHRGLSIFSVLWRIK